MIVESLYHACSKRLRRDLSRKEVAGYAGFPLREVLGKVLRSGWKTAVEDCYDFYQANFKRLVRPYPGIARLIRRLHSSKVKLAAFTSAERAILNINLGKLEFKKYFDATVSADEVSRRKPNPEGIHAALRSLQVGPDETIMVGDARRDIRAAKRAGIKIGAALWDVRPEKRAGLLKLRPDYTFRTVAEAGRLLLQPANSYI